MSKYAFWVALQVRREVCVADGVKVVVAELVGDGTKVNVDVGDSVGVALGVEIAVCVTVFVNDGVEVAIAELVGDDIKVTVGVGLGVNVALAV